MGNDVLILTIYFLVVIYVLYQMALSIESNLDNKVKVDLDRETLINEINKQLQNQPHLNQAIATVEQLEFRGRKLPPFLALKITSPNDPKKQRQIRITVTPIGRMTRNTSIKSLTVDVNNLTDESQVYIDWDKSSISPSNPRMQRVVRTGIPMGSNLSRAQVLSVVNPGASFVTNITGEGCLGVDSENRTLEAKTSLVDMGSIIAELSEGMGTADFGQEVIPAYSLRLMIGIRNISDQQDHNTAYLLLPFKFLAVLLPDEIAFPPLRWLLNRPRPENARDAISTLLLGRSSK